MNRLLVLFFVFSMPLVYAYSQKPEEAALKSGQEYFSKQMYNESVAEYGKAIEINPQYMEAYYNRALVQGYLGNFEQAIADFTKVLEIDPKRADVYYNRAVAYFRMNDFDKSWADVAASETMGFRPNSAFLKELKAKSGKKQPESES